MTDIGRFRSFVADFTRLIDKAGGNEEVIRADGGALLKDLVSNDDWLPDPYAQPDKEF